MVIQAMTIRRRLRQAMQLISDAPKCVVVFAAAQVVRPERLSPSPLHPFTAPLLAAGRPDRSTGLTRSAGIGVEGGQANGTASRCSFDRARHVAGRGDH